MISMIKEELVERMDKAVESYERDLATVRTGRANPTMLDRVQFDYYGTPTPINQMASISVQEGRQLVIKPYDTSTMKDIEHAILESDLGLNPQSDGSVIRLNVPALTEERRKEFVKQVKKYAENAKVAIRNIRRDANDDIKKLSDVSEDEKKRAQEDIQKQTDRYTKKIDEIAAVKEKDIMTV
ncbi:ribosome recycling factor [Beduini massiliensis]|uniref:ribosome recycling factor n=1 Tax=Beduini massiliensis TaxID=1585974 RepID=UPI00059A7E93|nr:ribosome recycling factor [Beduini massiliensis]